MNRGALAVDSEPTNRAAVEQVLARLVVGCRAFSAVQLSVSVEHWIPRSSAPLVDGAMLAAVVFSAAASCVLMLRAGTPRRPAAVRVDVAIGAVALAAMPWLIGPADATTWANWAYPITLFTACAAGACFRPRGVLLSSGLLMTGYLLEARHLGSEFDLSTLVANALSYPLFTAAAFFLARLLRRLGSLADQGAEARATLAGLQAGEIVRDQVRPLVHAYDNVVAGVTDERMPVDVREAFARDGLRLRSRARAFLEGRDSNVALSVSDELARLVEPDGQPAVRVHTEQWDLTLDAETARALLEAVDECALNARKHARASQVVVTALSTPTVWMVTVVDDGVGFDTTAGSPARNGSFGHGLRMLQGPRLARLAITCTILSVPDGGTIITLQGTP